MNALSLTNLTIAGKYRILVELGQGGTANVYLAVAAGPSGFNKLVVLKCLKASLGEDEEFRQMFLNEARLSARLNHPNAVQVHEVTEHAGLPVIVMEYLDGAALSTVRSRAGQKLHTRAHVRVLTDVLSALHYSHELADYDGKPLNVVHRDMTPQNVFITYAGHVKLLDFGIAKLSGSLVETRAGLVKGKLRYMPPEQISGAELDKRADVYAAGVMLWEAAAGTRMWTGLNDVAIMNRVLAGDIPTPSSQRPDVHPTLERICMRALAPKAADRYQTAEELRLDLEQFLSDTAPSVGTRAVADLMQECFLEDRERTRTIIGQQLGHVSLSRTFGPGSLTPVPLVRDLGDRYTDAPTGVTVQEPISTRRRQRGSKRVLWGASAACALALAGYAVFSRPSTAKVSTAEQALKTASAGEAKPEAAPLATPPKRTRVRLRIAAHPSEATLSLDGVALAGNPAVVELIADEREHRLLAEAPGHISEDVAITTDEDREIALTLDQKPSVQRPAWVQSAPQTAGKVSALPGPALQSPALPAAAVHGAVFQGAVSPSAVPQSAGMKAAEQRPAAKPALNAKAAADCLTPFYVDERGIKKFNPACFK